MGNAIAEERVERPAWQVLLEETAVACHRPASVLVRLTGTPLCQAKDVKHRDGTISGCQARAVPGDLRCAPHGGVMQLREDGTLGVIGPGTYHAISRLTGMGVRHVGNSLTGKINPSLNVLERIARVVGMSVGELAEYIRTYRDDK